MINTSKLMSSRAAFIDTAINKGGLLPLEEYSTCEKHINVELFQNLKNKRDHLSSVLFGKEIRSNGCK